MSILRRIVPICLALLVTIVGLPAAPASAATRFGGVHWGAEPYYKTGKRYVWVVDNTRDAGWEGQIRRWVSWRNYAHDHNNQQLPIFFYYKGTDLGWGVNECPEKKQHIAICKGGENTSRQLLNYSDIGSPHLTSVRSTIGVLSDGAAQKSEIFRWNFICNALGAAMGLGDRYTTGTCMNVGSPRSDVEEYYDADDNATLKSIYHEQQPLGPSGKLLSENNYTFEFTASGTTNAASHPIPSRKIDPIDFGVVGSGDAATGQGTFTGAIANYTDRTLYFPGGVSVDIAIFKDDVYWKTVTAKIAATEIGPNYARSVSTTIPLNGYGKYVFVGTTNFEYRP